MPMLPQLVETLMARAVAETQSGTLHNLAFARAHR